MAAAVESMVVAGTEAGGDTGAGGSAAKDSPSATPASVPVAVPAVSAPPLRKAKTKEGKGEEQVKGMLMEGACIILLLGIHCRIRE